MTWGGSARGTTVFIPAGTCPGQDPTLPDLTYTTMPGGGFSRLANAAPADVDPAPAANGDEETFKLGEFSIDEYRPMRVVVIGAGFSGVLAGIRCVFISPGSQTPHTDVDAL